jgi:hypothetical protein
MALLELERFGGSYDVSLLPTWFDGVNFGGSVNTTGARDGGRCLAFSATAWLDRRPAVQTGVGIVGYVFKTGSGFFMDFNRRFISIFDGNLSNVHLTLGIVSTATPRLQVFRDTGGGTALTGATGTTTLQPLSWYVVEMRFSIHDTTGFVHVKLNGLDEIHTAGGPVTGLDTRNAGTGNWAAVRYGECWNNSGTAPLAETAWILNDVGSLNNNFIGDQTAVYLPPNGNSAVQFTPSGSPPLANWECVDEIPHNTDTDYVESPTTGHVDLLTLTDIPVAFAGKQITGVQGHHYVRQTVVGTSQVRPILKSGSTVINGSTLNLGQSAVYTAQRVVSESPTGSALYTEAEINSLLVGYEKVL